MTERLLAYTEYQPEAERHRETLCTCGNGYFATRGAAPETPGNGVHYPGTYIAGVYDRRETVFEGISVSNEDLVNAPNWLCLTFCIDGGDWFCIDDVEILSFEQEFDTTRNILSRRVRFRDKAGRTTDVSQRRFVHMRESHVAGLETVLRAEDWSGRVTVLSAIDGRVENHLVKGHRLLVSDHLQGVEAGGETDLIWLETATIQSRILIAEAARTRVYAGETPMEGVERRTTSHPDRVEQELSFDIERDRPVEIEKVVAVYTSRDAAISEPLLEARRTASLADGFDQLLESHVLEWNQLMSLFRLGITPQDQQMIVNLHIAHILEVASPNTIGLDVGIPARGLHGEAYRGHVFWDDLFVFPFVTYRMPALTRSLLLYRYRRLGEAKRAAKSIGCEGAMFPWQSGSSGREETPVAHLDPETERWYPEHTHLQRHIGSAVAYNLWQYFQITGDLAFMSAYGAETLLEIARFYASSVAFDKVRERFVIRGVMGPDELHSAYPDADKLGLDNNAYTNVMAAWVMCRALDLLERLPEPERRIVLERVALRPEEPERWDEISRGLYVPFLDSQIISEFDGYQGLMELDWDRYLERYGDLQRLHLILQAEGDTPNRYKVSKQADVLMLFYLFSSDELRDLFSRLGYDLPPEAILRNIEYYTPRTIHGSTLSGVAHAWVLARSDRRRSWQFLVKALMSDVADTQGGTTEEGIHMGAMAGSLDILQRAYTGLEPREDVLWLDPVLPDALARLQMTIRYRGQWMDLDIDHERVRVISRSVPPEPVRIGYGGRVHEIRTGVDLEFSIAKTALSGPYADRL